MAAAMAAKAVAKKRAGGKFKPTPFVAPELPWRTKPEVEKKSWSSIMVLKMQPLWTPQCGTGPDWTLAVFWSHIQSLTEISFPKAWIKRINWHN